MLVAGEKYTYVYFLDPHFEPLSDPVDESGKPLKVSGRVSTCFTISKEILEAIAELQYDYRKRHGCKINISKVVSNALLALLREHGVEVGVSPNKIWGYCLVKETGDKLPVTHGHLKRLVNLNIVRIEGRSCLTLGEGGKIIHRQNF